MTSTELEVARSNHDTDDAGSGRPVRADDRRREARRWAAASTLDVLWVLYDRVLRHPPRHRRRPRPRPVPAVQGPRADGLLRGARRQGLPRPGVGSTTGPRSTRRSACIPTACSCPASRSAPARSATGSGSASAPRSGCGRRAAPRRTVVLLGDGELDEGSNHEAIALRRAVRARPAHRDRDRQPFVEPRLAGRHRRAGSRSRAGPRATVDGRDHDALVAAPSPPTTTAARPSWWPPIEERTDHDQHREADAHRVRRHRDRRAGPATRGSPS